MGCVCYNFRLPDMAFKYEHSCNTALEPALNRSCLPRIKCKTESGVWSETVIRFVAQCGPVDQDVVHGWRDIEVILLVEAQQVLVNILPLVYGHVAPVQNL